MTCEILDSGRTVAVAEIAVATGSGDTRTGPLFIMAPADQVSRVETLLEQIDLDNEIPPLEDARRESDDHVCPGCETPYRPEDYDPRALRIYCSASRTALPRHVSPRFGGRSGNSPATRK